MGRAAWWWGVPWNRFRAARTERAVSGRSDDERSKSTAPQRHVHRRARAGRRAHLDESGASGEVVEGPSRKDLAVGGRCVLSAAKDDVWRGWWCVYAASACGERRRLRGGTCERRMLRNARRSSGSSGHASGGRCRSVASGAVERVGASEASRGEAEPLRKRVTAQRGNERRGTSRFVGCGMGECVCGGGARPHHGDVRGGVGGVVKGACGSSKLSAAARLVRSPLRSGRGASGER